jgi:hypothetical protein
MTKILMISPKCTKMTIRPQNLKMTKMPPKPKKMTKMPPKPKKMTNIHPKCPK